MSQNCHFRAFTLFCRGFDFVAISAFFCVNLLGQKLRLRKFVDKYHVWIQIQFFLCNFKFQVPSIFIVDVSAIGCNLLMTYSQIHFIRHICPPWWTCMQLIGKSFLVSFQSFLADIFFPMPRSSKVHKCMIYINVHKNAWNWINQQNQKGLHGSSL